ncbi:uncharacterized protein LOC126896932 [Daktulosphaira vitifoliae]|uniref:uncharacterized protein LOC126896932 n=1 Tax=Daktulosphaira vitifoliae TaxID=58002 RepID=UPI0021A9EE5F|nr:uncharacterized protein LOC126896932 [Daktulosphaira vitifoliae]
MTTKKYRRFYETAFDSNISKSDEDFLSAEQHDIAVANKFIGQLQISASTCSIKNKCDTHKSKKRLFGFLRKRINGQQKYRSSDSMVTSCSLSLDSITSDSLSSNSSESPYYKRYPEPHILSPISDKSSLDAAEILDKDLRKNVLVKTKPPQSLGLLKLNRDHQHHGSDSGISMGSKPGDNSYQELLDLPFDMPKLKRIPQNFEVFHVADKSEQSTSTEAAAELPFNMPKLRRKQIIQNSDTTLSFDIPELRKKQMENCARVISLNFEIGQNLSIDQCSNKLNNFNEADNENSIKSKEDSLNNFKTKNELEKKPDRSSLFLNVKSRCNPVDNKNNIMISKPIHNRSQSNRPALSLFDIKPLNFVDDINLSLPLDQQPWYHGPLSRIESEKILQNQEEGSYLVREIKGSYALSIKCARGYIHIRITSSDDKNYLGQSEKPFPTIPDLIRHYTLNRLPEKGTEHVGLLKPIAPQIL